MPFIDLAIADLEEGVTTRGWGGHACTVVRTLQEERAGVGPLRLAYGART